MKPLAYLIDGEIRVIPEYAGKLYFSEAPLYDEKTIREDERKKIKLELDGHWSDCSVHNEPAYPNEECDCGGYPPKQVDLTDDEICDVWVNCEQSAWNIKFARAVIAADRDKNK